MFLIFPAWSLTHNSFSPVPGDHSDPTGTPSSSRPAWWRPWWLTWVWATSEWIWCPTTMETLWPWSCSTGVCVCVSVCLFVTNSQKQSKMMNCSPPLPLSVLLFSLSCSQTRSDQNRTGHLTFNSLCLSNGGTVQFIFFGHVVDCSFSAPTAGILSSVISEVEKE